MSGPFGGKLSADSPWSALVGAQVRVSRLEATDCDAPVDFFEGLVREETHPGAVLMESAALGSPDGTRSLVVPSGVIRLELRGGRAHYRPLRPEAGAILQAMAEQDPGARMERGGLACDFPTGAPDPALPDEARLTAPSVLDAVRRLATVVEDESRGGFTPPGVYGAFSYELVDNWESLPPRAPDPWDEPDISLVLGLDTVRFDHQRGDVEIVTRRLPGESPSEAAARHQRLEERLRARKTPRRSEPGPRRVVEQPAESDFSDAEFLEAVKKLLRHIREGDIFQAVLARSLLMESRAHPLAVYRMLRLGNPSPYMFHLDLGDGVLLGASPETCLKVEGGDVEIRPIAGTAPRGFGADGALDEELDSRLAVGLLLDHKEQAEHAMLVDLARNDVARVSVAGSRRVATPFSIEKYSHVQHLVSGVTGRLRPGLDALHAYRAAANMGTLTGAPKLRAMELIRDTEPEARGFYGGAVGYLLQDGSFDSCIVIRSMRHRAGRYLTRAGAGIVADSLPEKELAETRHKARACRLAVARAEAELGRS